MVQLGLWAGDLQCMILTGFFDSQLNVEAVLGLGVDVSIIETSANGAGFGVAFFLDDDLAGGERIAARAERVSLDADFNRHHIEAFGLSGALELPGRP